MGNILYCFDNVNKANNEKIRELMKQLEEKRKQEEIA